MLTRDTCSFASGQVGPAEITSLSVIEVDAQGKRIALESFDVDDVVAAYDALDARWIATDEHWLGASLRRSVDACDWDAFASVFEPGCTFIDHRLVGWGRVDVGTFVDYQRGIAELSPDAHWSVDHVRKRGNVYLSVNRVHGDESSGSWEIAFITVGVVQPDGRGTHCEGYDLSDLSVALERFEQLAADNSG